MPSYDIIPLASDLLDYTIQRVKQKEAEYKPVKAYIMVGDQLVEKLLYDKVKDDGKPHFPKSQTFHLCAELQDCAVRILKGCEAANGRYFETEYEERLHIRWYGRYMDDFFLIHPDKDYLQFCLKEIRVFMASLGLELNEKTQIFPIRNGIDFLGFHTYLTEEGKVIRKLRHSSIKRMRSKLRRWEQDYPAGLVTREKILQSWQAWDAHAAHGNTWSLRQQVRDRVQNILKEEI